jgi:hypothetical protein
MATGRDIRRGTADPPRYSTRDGDIFWWALAVALAVARWKGGALT